MRHFCIRVMCIVGLSASAVAQTPGTCEHGVATRDLDVGNVRAAIYNNGNLFWQGGDAVYEVPKGGGVHSLFTNVLWVGGLVDGELRISAARYGRYQFWPGPLSDDASPPADCGSYDRIYKLSRSDVDAFESDGTLISDLAEWPSGLGAPTLSPTNPDGSETADDGIDNDRDGRVDEVGEMRSITDEILQLPFSQRSTRLIDLAAGERPELQGDQMLWWVMNDVGNQHAFSDGSSMETTPPIGLEVHASAFAFTDRIDLANTTFFRYRIINRNRRPLEDAYVGFFSDPDLGVASNDYVGSDTTLGLGITYNGTENDSGYDQYGYGITPPAIAQDVLLGPIVESAGDTAITLDGTVAGYRNLSMTAFLNYQGGGAGFPYTDPNLALDYYRYMQGVWKDGTAIREYGDGFHSTTFPASPVTTYMYAGNYGRYWSEQDTDNRRTPNAPADRRFVMSTGPFSMRPGEMQDILTAIVWARAATRFDSYVAVKVADEKIQRYVNSRFYESQPPDAPSVQVFESHGSLTLTWTNNQASNNYLDSFREPSPLSNPEDPYYYLEGYEVWQFDSADATWPACVERETCELLQVFDKANGITEVRGDDDGDGFIDVYARGADSGIRHALTLDGLQDYRSYYYGVRAYAYSDLEVDAVVRSPFARITAVPTTPGYNISPDAIAATTDSSEYDIVGEFSGQGSGFFGANVVDPGSIRACAYRVEFLSTVTGTTYDIYCGDDKVLDGSGKPPTFGTNIGVVDGLEITVLNTEIGIKNFVVVANAAGTLDPPDIGTFAFNSNGYPEFEGQDRPTRGYQQSTNDSAWGLHHGGGSDNTWATFVRRVLRNDNLDRIGIYDYEMRWTESGGEATRAFDDGVDIAVPYELWRTGIDTPDDPSDDVRLIPYICEAACGAGAVANKWDITGDSGVSGGADDPQSDWTYWYLPEDQSPGQAGYEAWFAGTGDEAGELFARTILVNWNGGETPPYNADQPEVGTVFRIETLKPLQPGDIFTFTTTGLEPTPLTQSQQVSRLDDIGIVPNPYRGRSQYETSSLKDEVRFTNLPDEATIRVFALNGRLVRTIYKNIPGQEWLSWDLRSDSGRHLASGIYLVHVEVPDVGTHVIKFGYVGKRWGD